MINDLRKKCVTKVLQKLADAVSSDQYRNALGNVLPAQAKPKFSLEADPYLGSKVESNNNGCNRDDIVFVSGRFRSGSTLLWNLFRSAGGFTAYYEPFNERKWFDKTGRGELVDATHVGVDDYSKEYNNLEDLDQYFDERWIRHHLYMDENNYDYKMKRYIELMVQRAPNRPVLQFNRVDFRLGWLRHQFPNSKIIHIFRHPRDQWCSFLVNNQNYPADGSKPFDDRFYLELWCADLQSVFPFLAADVALHPYQRFYLLWRLSYIFGKKYSDVSVSLEDLSQNPETHIQNIYSVIGHNAVLSSELLSIPKPISPGKWKSYADENWFSEHESVCESILQDYCRV